MHHCIRPHARIGAAHTQVLTGKVAKRPRAASSRSWTCCLTTGFASRKLQPLQLTPSAILMRAGGGSAQLRQHLLRTGLEGAGRFGNDSLPISIAGTVAVANGVELS